MTYAYFAHLYNTLSFGMKMIYGFFVNERSESKPYMMLCSV